MKVSDHVYICKINVREYRRDNNNIDKDVRDTSVFTIFPLDFGTSNRVVFVVFHLNDRVL
jgi:hypothetical protein